MLGHEPSGNQDVWHLHVHVFPRYDGDDLYRSGPPRFADEDERLPYSTRMRKWFALNGSTAVIRARVGPCATEFD